MDGWSGVASRVALLVVLACAVSACDKTDGSSTTQSGTQKPGEAPVAVVQMQNDAGQAVTVEFCSDCHATPKPAVHTADEWPGVMARMLDNMRRGGKRSPGNTQIETILDYLQTNARP